MEIRLAAGDIVRTRADGVVVGLFEGEKLAGDIARVDQALDGAISQLVNLGEIKGKANEVTVIHTLGKLPAARVLVIGLGKQKELMLDKVRNAVAEVCRLCQKRGITRVASAVLGAGIAGISAESAARAITEGALLGTYAFREHKTKDREDKEIKTLTVIDSDRRTLPALRKGHDTGNILAEATNAARDMVNQPANHMTPTDMAAAAARISKAYGLELTVLEREQMRELGMGALLGVAQGSQQPPKFVVLRYRGRRSQGVDIALVGKGITFDSGGISLKPAEKMEEMKGDMSGGAAVMNALAAIARFKPKVNVTAIIPATENLPGGSALKPGDVLKAMSGKTIEIISTDAEGRLILSDALSYAKKLGARRIIDVATLTGACHIALGELYSGGFTNNQEMLDKLIAAGKEAGEHIWQLPADEKYSEYLKSDVADMKNTGPRWGGAITAARFLAEFVGDIPWVHLDIAGTFLSEKDSGATVKGATGVPVRTLVNYVLSQAR
ncbi:MAG: leucyl aminopeptidase [Chloroflexi bacterium]|nr:leucyl aminopeptidase [Chloroflexota bacterium]